MKRYSLKALPTKYILLLLWMGWLGPHLVGAQPFEAEFITKLTASDAAAANYFGYPVVIDDGVLAIGAPGRNENQGAVYIFRQQPDGTWAEEARLVSSDGGPNDQFGDALALDGNVLLVGALQHTADGVRAGAAYVFQYENTTWTEQHKLLPDVRTNNTFFGESVALNDAYAFIGAPGNEAVYVYDRTTWTEKAQLVPFNANEVGCFACTLAANSAYVIVGDFDRDAAYVYRYTNEDSWEAEVRLADGDATDTSYFGESIALHEETILIGADWDREHGQNAGAAYVYQREETGWSDPIKLVPYDIRERITLGRAVALDRGRAFIGAYDAVYVFDRNETGTWKEVDKIALDVFVESLAVAQGHLAIGLASDDEAAENAGATLLYAFPPLNQAPVGATFLTPAGNTTIDLSGDPTQSFVATWRAAVDPEGDPVTYMWQLSLSNDFVAPLLSSNVGSATHVETTYGVLASALTAVEVMVGTSVPAYMRIVASDGVAEATSAIVQVTLIRGLITATEPGRVPQEFALHLAYPNPFNPTTTIRYALPEAVHIRLAVYDILGREIALLVDGNMAAGEHAVVFEAATLPSGTYLYRLEAGPFSQTRRLTLVK